MRKMMLVILVVMVGSILSIVVIKPFSNTIGANHTDPKNATQQPDPQQQ